MQSIDGDMRTELSDNIKQKYQKCSNRLYIVDVSATVSREMQMTAIKSSVDCLYFVC